MKNKIYTVLGALFLLGSSAYSQAITLPAGKFATAAYATGGSSIHKEKVLWLTWGAQNASDLYGKHGQEVKDGYTSYAIIDLGGGHELRMVSTISKLVYSKDGAKLSSYAPGNYSGDSMDNLYNIGGTDSNNQLVSGLATSNGVTINFKVTSRATIDGKPVKLSGMVLGDAESLNGSGENFYAIGDGKWTIVDLKKNTGAGAYNVKKTTGSDKRSKLHFLKGNDNNTGAVAFMTFNETAYKGANHEVEFDVELTGTGVTAISLGLIPPLIDSSDAPESYGAAFHMLEAYVPTNDNVGNDVEVNLNPAEYKVGSLEVGDNSFLGTTAADTDTGIMYSKDAKGDDNTGTGGPNEEDAWPKELNGISHLAENYQIGKEFIANIQYYARQEGYISGWIDFNLNGKFDDNERVTVKVPQTAKGTLATAELKWIIPVGRVIKSTYVRLRAGYNELDVQSPTDFATGGEVEDHKIYILRPAVTNPMLLNHVKTSKGYAPIK